MHGRPKIKMWKSCQIGPKISKMMKWFQIWPQNVSRITFDPFFGQKTFEYWQNTRFSQFSAVFFYQKGVKCYPIGIPRPNFEFYNHFGYFRPTFDMILTFWFFWRPMHFQKKCKFTKSKFLSRKKCYKEKLLKLNFAK